MKFFLCFVAAFSLAGMVFAQNNPVNLSYLEEKIQKLRAEVEDLQYRQKRTEQDLEAIRTDLQELRVGMSTNANSASTTQLNALAARIEAVDQARQQDKKAIVEQLANELSKLGSQPALVAEHVVEKGDTLSGIARAYGVSIADIKRVNSLTSDVINVGQKLIIPK